MITEIIFFTILLALLCWEPPWQTISLNIRPISNSLAKFSIFATLIVSFLLVAGNPTKTSQLNDGFHEFTAGLFIVLFAKGPRIGNVDPISTRPLMIIIGLASMMWGLVALTRQ